LKTKTQIGLPDNDAKFDRSRFMGKLKEFQC